MSLCAFAPLYLLYFVFYNYEIGLEVPVFGLISLIMVFGLILLFRCLCVLLVFLVPG